MACAMENERSDPPLPQLCSHQVPWRKCPECSAELEERKSKALSLIKSILARTAKPVSGDTESNTPPVANETVTDEDNRDEDKS